MHSYVDCSRSSLHVKTLTSFSVSKSQLCYRSKNGTFYWPCPASSLLSAVSGLVLQRSRLCNSSRIEQNALRSAMLPKTKPWTYIQVLTSGHNIVPGSSIPHGCVDLQLSPHITKYKVSPTQGLLHRLYLANVSMMFCIFCGDCCDPAPYAGPLTYCGCCCCCCCGVGGTNCPPCI